MLAINEIRSYTLEKGEHQLNKMLYGFEANTLSWMKNNIGRFHGLSSVGFLSSSVDEIKRLNKSFHAFIINLDDDKLGKVMHVNSQSSKSLMNMCLKLSSPWSMSSLGGDGLPIKKGEKCLNFFEVYYSFNAIDVTDNSSFVVSDISDLKLSEVNKKFMDISSDVRGVLDFDANFKTIKKDTVNDDDDDDDENIVIPHYHYDVLVKKNGKYIYAYSEDELIAEAPEVASLVIELNQYLLNIDLDYNNGVLDNNPMILGSKAVLRNGFTVSEEVIDGCEAFFWENIHRTLKWSFSSQQHMNLLEKGFLSTGRFVDDRNKVVNTICDFYLNEDFNLMELNSEAQYGPFLNNKSFAHYYDNRSRHSDLPKNEFLNNFLAPHLSSKDNYGYVVSMEENSNHKPTYVIELNYLESRIKFFLDNKKSFISTDDSLQLFDNYYKSSLRQFTKIVSDSLHKAKIGISGSGYSADENKVYLELDSLSEKKFKESLDLLIKMFFDVQCKGGEDKEFIRMAKNGSALLRNEETLNDFVSKFVSQWQKMNLEEMINGIPTIKLDSATILGNRKDCLSNPVDTSYKI